MSYKPSTFLWFATLLQVAARSASAAVTYTVDDGDSSISYFPSGAWSQAPACNGCSAQPDTSRANGGTWHQATYGESHSEVPYIEVQFTGTAIYVYNILAGPASGSLAGTHLQFTWDGQYDRGSDFNWDAEDSRSVEYGQMVYYIEGLEHGAHTLRIQPDTSRGSTILFDYIRVTSDSAPPATAPSPSSTMSTSPTPPAPSPSSTSPSTPTLTPTPTSASTQNHQSGSPDASEATSTTPNTHLSSSPSLSTASPSSHSFDPTAPFTSSSSGHPSALASQTAEPSSSAGRSPAGVIAGATIGGIVVLVLVFLGACLLRRRRRNARLPILPTESEKGGIGVYGTDLPPEPSSATRLLPGPSSAAGLQPTTEYPSSVSPSTANSNSATVPTASSFSSHMESQGGEPYISHDMEKPPVVAGSDEPVDAPEAETGVVAPQAGGPRELAAFEAAEEAQQAPEVVARHRVSTGSAALHVQLAALQEEVARLREHVDAPPRYE
ncbi:hypothetical protein C8Q80DRAFT_1127378 [Daedaleopsis nitida]|nr:hypothetical protein C8Q80DRAFT_1127378 [Daedaleopsis nitida]